MKEQPTEPANITKTDEQLLCEMIHAETKARGPIKDLWNKVLTTCHGDTDQAYNIYIRAMARHYSGIGLGTCPKCGSCMKYSTLSTSALRFFLVGQPEESAWVCVRCHEISGANTINYHVSPMPLPEVHPYIPDDLTFDTNLPEKNIQLPYESSATKRFWFSRHASKLVIDKQGLCFTDTVDSKYSFNISKSGLKQATFKNSMGDISITLLNGAVFEIGLGNNNYDDVMAAIRLAISDT